MDLYDIQLELVDGTPITMNDFKNQVLLIVNTACFCEHTPQFEQLEALFQKYQDKPFNILAFPCNQFMHQDPGTNKEIETFCSLHYHTSFPLFKKTRVKGNNKNPLFEYSVTHAPVGKNQAVADNFEKFLINKQGHVIQRYPASTEPKTIEKDIINLLELT